MKVWKVIPAILLMGLLVAGCSGTRSGSTERIYRDLVTVKASDNSTVVITAEFGGIVSDTMQESGDASAETNPQFSAAFKQSQAQTANDGASLVLKDLQQYLDERIKANSDNVTETTPVAPPVVPVVTPPVVVPPDVPPVVEPDEPIDLDTLDLTDYDIIATVPCDGELSYSHNGGPKVIQPKCVFDGKYGPDYGKQYLIVWSDGNKLVVPDSSNLAMGSEAEGFRKFQPGGEYSNSNPDIPFMEVYAARGTNPTSASVLAKKPVAPVTDGPE